MPRAKTFEPSSTPPAVIVETMKKTTTVPAEVDAASNNETEDKIDLSTWFASIPPAELHKYNFYLKRMSEEIRNAENPEKDTFMIRFMPPDGAIDTRPNSRQRSLAEITDIDPHFWSGLEAWTSENAGGGGYRLQINSTKTGNSVYTKSFRIMGPPQPMPFETYRGNGQASPGASGDADFKKFLLDWLKEQRESAKQGGQEVGSFDRLMEMVKQANSQAIEMARSQVAPGKDPAETLASVLGILKDLGVVKGTGQVEASELDKFLERMAKMQELGMIPKHNSAPPPEKEGLVKEITTGVIETLKTSGMLGKRVAAPGTNWNWIEPLAKTAMPVILPLLARFIPGGGVAGAPNGGGIILQRKAAPGAAPSNVMPMLLAPDGQPPTPQPTAVAPVSPPATQAAPQPVTITPEIANQLRWHDVTHAIVDWVRHDMEGSEAAATLKNMYPDQCAQLAVMSPELLKGLFQSEPTLSAVKEHPKLVPFIAEFLAYLNPAAEVEEPGAGSQEAES